MHVREFFWRPLKRPKLWHLLKIPSALAILCIHFCSWTTPNQNSHCLPRLITSTCTLRVLYVVPALISVISNFMQLTCEMEVPVYIRPASSDNGVRKRGSHFFFFTFSPQHLDHTYKITHKKIKPPHKYCQYRVSQSR